MKATPGQAVEVQADDVNVDTVDGTAFWNFTATDDDNADPVTVAAFPFAVVNYVTSA
jgi:hypothetical protein